MTATQMEHVRCKLGFDAGLCVERVGISGGLALLWKEGFDVQVQSFSSSHIDSFVVDSRDNRWRFSGFYGSSKSAERHHSWSLLRRLSDLFNMPWLCCGDFNEISSASEKKCGNAKMYSVLSAFHETLNFCEFRDLGFKGTPFTWWNRCGGNNAIFERLDIGLGTLSWCELFQNHSVRHLPYWGSDHRPLLIKFDSKNRRWQSNYSSRPRCFHMEELWTKFSNCKDIISSSWKETSRANEMSAIQEKLNKCDANLSTWSWQKFGGNSRRMDFLKKEFESQLNGKAIPNVLTVHNLDAKLNELLVCSGASETISLTLWSCNSTVEVGHLLLGDEVLQQILVSDFPAIFLSFWRYVDSVLFNLFILGCWRLWTNRNNVVHDSVGWTTADMVAWIDNYANEFQLANELNHKEVLSHQPSW
ncbi:hypothetical protein LWI28_025643 [Acer negundo]|uniref:Endonuclease/exonuclease/phosphatase domain-containing protein n=1 Tax=Acer negundo TaxID=4023 RepID=A0AAD5NZ61_ACENE|nr:hypothetical protein LWI28_025643 [Acer negundo]